MNKVSVDLFFVRDLSKDELRYILYRLNSDLVNRFGDDYDGWGLSLENCNLSKEEIDEMSELI